MSHTDYLSTWDYLVFFIALFITLGLARMGLFSRSRRSPSGPSEATDYILMGRQLTLPFFVATLVATWYGGIFGVTQMSFEKGIYTFVTQGVFWYGTYILFALFLVQKIRAHAVLTLPEMVGEMIGPKARKLSAVFNFFNILPISYLMGLGLFLQGIFGGSLPAMNFVALLLALMLTFKGGLRSVVYADLIQFVLMCTAVFVVVLFAYLTYGGVDFLTTALPHKYFQPLGEEKILTTIVWGLIALSTLVDPSFYQRCLASKSTDIARKGILISTCIWFCFDICTTLGGMYARAVMPEADSTGAYMLFALKLLPSGLRGLFLAGIVATILSTLDAFLLIAGTTLSYDLAPSFLKKWKSRHQIGLVVSALIAYALTIPFQGNIREVWFTMGSYSAACLLFPMLLGHFKPGLVGDKAFCFSSITAAVVMTLWKHTEHLGFWKNVDAFYVGLFITCTGILGARAWDFKLSSLGRND